MRQVDGIMSSRLDTYCDAVISQNINGAVLAHCNINELKSVLNMNFGDWEMFQLVLLSLRDHEKTNKRQRKLSSAFFMPYQNQDRNDHVHKDAQIKNETKPEVKKGKLSNSIAESAITMEDALISGLLSKLNDDAQEDIITDEILEDRKHSDLDSIYISRSSHHGGAAMTHSVGSEDAFNALEKGLSSLSLHRGSITISSSSRLDLDSHTSSPTKSEIKNPLINSSQKATKKANGSQKTKHLRDRLDTMNSDIQDDEPYAWITQTAPASPMIGRFYIILLIS